MRSLRLLAGAAGLAFALSVPIVALAQTAPAVKEPAGSGASLNSGGEKKTAQDTAQKAGTKTPMWVAEMGVIEVPFGTGQRSEFLAGQGGNWKPRPASALRW